jgi:hypothetical protein
MLQPPIEASQHSSRPLSIMTTATSATAQDTTGNTWMRNVDEENCWEDLILTLGTWTRSAHTAGAEESGEALSVEETVRCVHSAQQY